MAINMGHLDQMLPIPAYRMSACAKLKSLLILFVTLIVTVLCAALVGFSDEPAKTPQNSPANSDELMQRGERIYKELCASCHGAKGEGVEKLYERPLIGESTVGELSKYIDKSMPEGEPEKCSGPDSEAVAAYIHYAFYSEAAQLRNRPPRIELSRLTGTQLRQSMADLYGHFTNVPYATDRRGLHGVYFDGARWNKDKKRIDRVDPVLDFDFGREGPGTDISPKAFSIFWEGALLAEKTGRYEIIVRSTCSFVFNFGRHDRELINNHVQSGDQTEFRRTVVLTAGRAYPVKIDFIQRERKTEQPPASIRVSWIPPGGTEQVIPKRNWIPEYAPPSFSVQATIPPDDRSYGFERGIAVSREWDECTTAAALEFSQVATRELWADYFRRRFKKDDPDSNKDRKILKQFLTEIVSTAFRGPLDSDTEKRYVEQQMAATDDDAEAIKRTVLMCVKSPRFLYPSLDRDRTLSERVANRLSLTLFDSLPVHEAITKAISKDSLKDDDAIRSLARTMVKDYRTQAKMRDMVMEWLNIKQVGDLTKDEKSFPGFDAVLVSQMRQSLEAFVGDILSSETSDYRQLFRADWTYTSDRLAEFYGPAWQPLDNEGPLLPELRVSVTDSKQRFGVLTHPYLLSALAYYNSSSPIHRGIFLIKYVLGRTLIPPAEAPPPLSPDLHPDLTTRERVTLQTSPESCQVCHEKINGIGFVMENFDAAGRFRELDNKKAVNAQAIYKDKAGKEIHMNGVADLANYLVESEDAHRAFVTRAFQYFTKQPIGAYGSETLNELTDRFRKSNFNIRELVVEIAVIAATRDTTLQQQEG